SDLVLPDSEDNPRDTRYPQAKRRCNRAGHIDRWLLVFPFATLRRQCFQLGPDVPDRPYDIAKRSSITHSCDKNVASVTDSVGIACHLHVKIQNPLIVSI
uniref:Uncharacterized protein n=1 Tax=Anopheles atroparvus TaxID=41427 RepID=A0AAG5DRI3_ANOAO